MAQNFAGVLLWQIMRTAVYQQKALPLQTRIQIFEACVLSTAFYGAGAWTTISAQEWKSFSAGMLRLYKRILAKEIDHEELQRWTVEKTCSHLNLPPPDTYLTICRLRHFGTLCRQGNSAIWSLVALEQLWIEQVRADIQWLHETTVARSNRPSPVDDPSFWNNLACNCPGTWKNLIRKSRLHVQAVLQRTQLTAQWHAELGPHLTAAGIPWATNVVENEEADLPPQTLPCLRCKMVFHTKAAWAVHSFKKHGRKAASRYLAEGTTCDVCGRLWLYLSTYRLSLHLRYSLACATELRNRGLHVQPGPGVRSRLWRKEEADDRCPWLNTEGPRLPPCLRQDESMTLDQEDFMIILLSFEDKMLETPNTLNVDEWTADLRALCLDSILCLDALKETLQAYQRHFEDIYYGNRLRQQCYVDYSQAFTNVIESLCTEYFQPELNFVQVGTPMSTCKEAHLAALNLSDLAGYVPSPLLFPRFKQLVFVHLFSGRRRERDLQAQLEAIDWSPALPPLVLSIDVMVDSKACNLMQQGPRDFWIQQALKGAIDGGVAGPPCETSSTARSHESNTARDPRPLRTERQLWGIPGLSLKEERQTFTGNSLLTFAVYLQFILWLKGRWFALEHPREPLQEGQPSIWKLPVVKMLLTLTGYDRHLVWQGLFGGPSPKPTHLMLIHQPGDFTRLETSLRSTAMPPPLRMGKDEHTGYFRTAPLKEYPAQFNLLLARAFEQWHYAAPQPPSPEDLPDDDIALLKRLVVSMETSTDIFGPDFAGWRILPACIIAASNLTQGFEKKKVCLRYEELSMAFLLSLYGSLADCCFAHVEKPTCLKFWKFTGHEWHPHEMALNFHQLFLEDEIDSRWNWLPSWHKLGGKTGCNHEPGHYGWKTMATTTIKNIPAQHNKSQSMVPVCSCTQCILKLLKNVKLLAKLHAAQNQTPDSTSQGLAFLVSARTASAAELLVNELRSEATIFHVFIIVCVFPLGFRAKVIRTDVWLSDSLGFDLLYGGMIETMAGQASDASEFRILGDVCVAQVK